MSDTNAAEPGMNLESLTPMVDASQPPKEKEQTFDSDIAGLQSAAEAKEATARPEEPEPFVVEYKRVGGEDHGERVPPEEVITIEQAAKNLTDFRNEVDNSREYNARQSAASLIDAARAQRAAEVTGQPVEQPVEQQPAQQAQPAAEQQPHSHPSRCRKAWTPSCTERFPSARRNSVLPWLPRCSRSRKPKTPISRGSSRMRWPPVRHYCLRSRNSRASMPLRFVVRFRLSLRRIRNVLPPS